MIYFIKEAFQVYINPEVSGLIALIDVLLRLLYRLECISIGSKAIAVCFELHFKLWTDYLMHRLF